MMSLMRLWNCATGPQLYRFFDARDVSQIYQQNLIESVPSYFLNTAEVCFGIAKWGWPFYLPYVLKRVVSSTGERIRVRSVTYAVYSAGVLCLLMCAVLMRGVGRALNPAYAEFIAVLGRAQRGGMSTENKEALSRFDFEFWAWPAEFDAAAAADAQSAARRQRGGPRGEAAAVERAAGGPSDWLMRVCSAALVRTIGVRLTYPGCTALMNAATRSFVQQARARLRTEHRAERFKLRTPGGHDLELFFVDKRSGSGGNGSNGRTLVVCCEGNAAYPEIGATGVPLDEGYSVIGWHHPGFGGSTGLPLPETEQEFMLTVLLFAQRQLNFRLTDTAILAWSIGGYTAAWAGANFPEIKYLVLDATFDSIEELAVKTMPKFAEPLVREAVKREMNLNNAQLLCRYPGPVKLIRRSQDEMITTGTPDQVHTNRGNHLLIALLRYRYPNLVTESSLAAVHEFLARRKSAEVQQFLRSLGVNEADCASLLRQYLAGPGVPKGPTDLYPCMIGGDALTGEMKRNLLVFLASKTMVNMEATHCAPLSPALFTPPWSDHSLAGRPGASNNGGSDSDASWEPV